MSRIFDALKRVEWLRTKRKNTAPATASTSAFTERRKSSRIHVHVPVFMYGYTPSGNPFYEQAYTIVINGAGGLISTASSAQPGQRLVVTNEGNDETQECVVVSVEAQRARNNKIALKFPTPMPQFWRGLEIGNGGAL
jgi:hypothetical protein